MGGYVQDNPVVAVAFRRGRHENEKDYSASDGYFEDRHGGGPIFSEKCAPAAEPRHGQGDEGRRPAVEAFNTTGQRNTEATDPGSGCSATTRYAAASARGGPSLRP